jgi:heme-degrading monooxygenase HmoA
MWLFPFCRFLFHFYRHVWLLIMSAFSKTPHPPYYAVIFSTHRTPGDNGYGKMVERMIELASRQPGFLGVESARSEDGFGITVSYWASADAITCWKENVEHMVAQELGKAEWYEHYELRIAKVDRAYGKASA